MPSVGYATIGLKPSILSKLQSATDEYYPGMFLPSALIIMMNEIKRGQYCVEMYNSKIDFSGAYTSLTVRLDVKTWLKENYEINKDAYTKKYRLKNFTQFAGIFMLNVFESKTKSNNFLVKLKESDFLWLEEEYKKRKEIYKNEYSSIDFDKFADLFIKEIFDRMNHARKILSTY